MDNIYLTLGFLQYGMRQSSMILVQKCTYDTNTYTFNLWNTRWVLYIDLHMPKV